MKQLLKLFLLSIAVTSITACSGHLRVQSNPDKAKIEVVNSKDNSTQVIGETPLQMGATELNKFNGSGPYLLRITKDGFAPQDLIITSLAGVSIDYSIALKPYPIGEKTNALIEGLFNAQNLAQKANYKEALGVLDGLQSTYPDVAAVPEMIGSVLMLTGNIDGAVANFERAIALNPDNKELRGLLDSAQRSRGQRLPTGSGGN